MTGLLVYSTDFYPYMSIVVVVVVVLFNFVKNLVRKISDTVTLDECFLMF
jgi:hypothetical protein